MANTPDLWKMHVYSLGVREGVEDIGKVMESVIKYYRHSTPSAKNQEPMVDWKIAYRALRKLVGNIKVLVMKKAEEEAEAETDAEAESEAKEDIPLENSDLRQRLRSSFKVPARNKFSLMEMLEICMLLLNYCCHEFAHTQALLSPPQQKFHLFCFIFFFSAITVSKEGCHNAGPLHDSW